MDKIIEQSQGALDAYWDYMTEQPKPLKGRQKKFIEALIIHHGVPAQACKEIGISRIAYYQWLYRDQNFQKWMQIVEDERNDWYEQCLHKLIDDGNTSANIFALKSKASHRGWVEKNLNYNQNENVNNFNDDVKSIRGVIDATREKRKAQHQQSDSDGSDDRDTRKQQNNSIGTDSSD